MKKIIFTFLWILIAKNLFALDIVLPSVDADVGCYPGGKYIYHYYDVVMLTGLETGEYYYIRRWDNPDFTPPLTYLELLYTPGYDYINRDDFEVVDWNHGGIEGPKYKYTGSSSTAYFDYNFEIPNSGLIVGDYTTRPGIRIRKDGLFTTPIIKHSTITVIDPSSVSGEYLTCTSYASFNLQDQPFGSTVFWVIKQNGYTRAQGSGTTAQASNLTNGDADVDFTISFNCGINSILKHRDFWVGKPIPSILGPTTLECNFPEWYFINSESYQWGDFDWSTDYMLRIIGTTTGHKAKIEGLEEGYGQIFCEVTNTCGSAEDRLVVWIDCWGFRMSPNPAGDYVELTIEKDETKLSESKYPDSYEVRIYNSTKVLVYQKTTKEPSLRINTQNLVNGTYYVNVTLGENTKVKQLIVNH